MSLRKSPAPSPDLLALLDQERTEVDAQAGLAPGDEAGVRLMRMKMSLDRSVDRKVRITLSIRREYVRLEAVKLACQPRPEDPELLEAEKDKKSAEQSQNLYENKGK